jgi:hypothetical protein
VRRLGPFRVRCVVMCADLRRVSTLMLLEGGRICGIHAFVVAWTLSDLAGRYLTRAELVSTALSFRQGGGAR